MNRSRFTISDNSSADGKRKKTRKQREHIREKKNNRRKGNRGRNANRIRIVVFFVSSEHIVVRYHCHGQRENESIDFYIRLFFFSSYFCFFHWKSHGRHSRFRLHKQTSSNAYVFDCFDVPPNRQFSILQQSPLIGFADNLITTFEWMLQANQNATEKSWEFFAIR